LKLYGFAPSPNTWKCRALGAHLGVTLEFVPVDLTKREQRDAEFLTINPSGRTPALVDGDFKLWESTAILHYIASKKPGSINPEDARGRADVIRWQGWQLAHWGADACVPIMFQKVAKGFLNMGEPDEAIVSKALDVFAREASFLDKHLEGRSWIVGDDVTIADFSVGAPLFYAETATIPLGDYPGVVAWFKRLSSLPCWGETAPLMGAAA